MSPLGDLRIMWLRDKAQQWLEAGGHAERAGSTNTIPLFVLSVRSKSKMESFCSSVVILYQQFSSGVLQEFLKHTEPVCFTYLFRSTDLFSLKLSNKKMTAADTIAILCEGNQNYIYFWGQIGSKYIFWCYRILVSSLCVP